MSLSHTHHRTRLPAAEAGECDTVQEIKRKLALEGYVNIDRVLYGLDRARLE